MRDRIIKIIASISDRGYFVIVHRLPAYVEMHAMRFDPNPEQQYIAKVIGDGDTAAWECARNLARMVGID